MGVIRALDARMESLDVEEHSILTNYAAGINKVAAEM